MNYTKIAFALCAVASSLVTASAASARPNVGLRLQGLVVSKSADGTEVTTPIERAQPAPGQTIRYQIVASNTGSDPARHFSSVGNVPAGTAYVPGSARAASARIEFSLDGGKTWSPNPTVTLRTAQGTVQRNADPQTFTAVRWSATAPLAPKTSQTFAYAVRVK